MKIFLPAVAALTLALSSCIKEEALNAECDITGVDSTWFAANRDILVGNPAIENDYVVFSVKSGVDKTALDPKFTLTPGATLTMKQGGQDVPANGQVRNFSTPQVYTTHSEDGLWSKNYTVAFNTPQPLGLCSFEHFQLVQGRYKYYTWMEVDSTDVENPFRPVWASGNGGFDILGMAKQPEDYPTTVDPLGVNGNCVKLVTKGTGGFGAIMGMPIAAGNIFIGTFDAKNATSDALNATRFGLQIANGKPLTLSGYYKYTAGDTFQDEHQTVHPELHDTADIYAVIYEVDPSNFVPLNGNDVLSSDRIVMLARIANPGEPADWKHFSEPFVEVNGKEFDTDRFWNNGYAIAVVATSSRQGAFFQGAVGSTLYIDEIKVEWDKALPATEN